MAEDKSFRSCIFGGYSREDVNNFVERIGKEFDKVQKENNDLRDLLESMRMKLDYYQQMENTLHNAILVAQKSSEQVRENANKECDLLRKEAELSARNEIAGAESRVRELSAEYLRLQQEAVTFRTNFKALLGAQQEVIERYFSN
ncbi:MAG: DivIVA domain-containing protein [Negativicutes bacterium]|jgi:cell division initiation protein